MSIKGTLKTMAMADVLSWISTQSKTGVLHLERADVTKRIYFDLGQIISSGSTDPNEYMGQFFISFGNLSEDDLVKAYQVQRDTKVYIGKILVMIGKATEPQVQKVLVHKTRECVLDCFLWNDGLFSFEEQTKALDGSRVEVALDTSTLIREGHERVEEWKKMRASVSSAQAPFQLQTSAFPPGFPEKADDRKLVSLLEQNRSISEICYEFHMSEFLVTKKIYLWMEKGFIQKPKQGLVSATPAPRRATSHDATLQDAKKFMELKKWKEAEAKLKEFLVDLPIHAEALALYKKAQQELIATLDGDINENLIPKVLGSMSASDLKKFSTQEGYVYSRINGKWSIGEIVQICPFGRDKVFSALMHLRAEKLIQF